MKKSETKFVLLSFVVWKFILFIIFFIASKFLTLKTTFLGGGYSNYIENPYLWLWGNFDGEHYINIAQNGYGYGEYAFFPLLPIILKAISNFLGRGLTNLIWGGVVVSSIATLVNLFGFYKLARIDYSEKISKVALLLLLFFPTSFYFSAVYTESIFLALLVWGVYFAKKNKWLYASLLGFFITLTRFVGVIIIPVYIAIWLLENKKISPVKLMGVVAVSASGLVSYMLYLKSVSGSAVSFFTNMALFGEQRSSHIVLLPQVIYRYLFKIIPGLNTNYFPVIFTTYLEFFVASFFILLIIVSFKKIKFYYWILLLLGFIIPTFSGSFSSLPRYVVVLFPAYFFMANILATKKKRLFAFCTVSFILLVISFSLFARGYWLS